jgi:hypothetical protein
VKVTVNELLLALRIRLSLDRGQLGQAGFGNALDVRIAVGVGTALILKESSICQHLKQRRCSACQKRRRSSVHWMKRLRGRAVLLVPSATGAWATQQLDGAPPASTSNDLLQSEPTCCDSPAIMPSKPEGSSPASGAGGIDIASWAEMKVGEGRRGC